MTIDPVELERLSKAATQGVCPCCRAPCDVTIKPAYDFAWKDEFGNYQTTRHPAKRQYTYRTGQLVPAQPSGDVVEAVARIQALETERIGLLQANLEANTQLAQVTLKKRNLETALAEAEGRVKELESLLRIEREHRNAPGPF